MEQRKEPRELEWWEDTNIYVMKAGDAYYKIGISKNPKARRCQLQHGCPLEITIELAVGMMPWCYAENLERSVHEDLADLRVRGEWFRIEDIELLESVKREIRRCVEKSQREWRANSPPYVSLPGRWE